MQQRKAPLRDAAIPVEHVVRAAVALHTHTLNPLPRFGGCLVVGSALSWGFEKGRMRHKSSAALAGPTAARSMLRVRLLRYCCFGRPNSQPPRFLKHQLSLLVVDVTGCVALPHSHSVFSFLSCPYTTPRILSDWHGHGLDCRTSLATLFLLGLFFFCSRLRLPCCWLHPPAAPPMELRMHLGSGCGAVGFRGLFGLITPLSESAPHCLSQFVFPIISI
jgi:hypothetical protein